MRKLLAFLFALLAALCWWLVDFLYPVELRRAMGGPVIPEPPYGEQDTQPYDTEATEPLTTLGNL